MLRTALAALFLTASPALAEQFSIRCTADTVYFLTFDTDARRMVWEAVQGGTYRGRIDGISDTEIEFSVPVGRDKRARAVFMREGGPGRLAERRSGDDAAGRLRARANPRRPSKKRLRSPTV